MLGLPLIVVWVSSTKSVTTMPIYEFYCPECHTIFSFFAQASQLREKPACPRCARPDLERRPSRFATLRHSGGDGGSDDHELDAFSSLEEGRLERALEGLASEAESLGDTEDPRAMGQLLRKFGDLSGLELGSRMEEALSRMEAGEDPETIDQELEADLAGDGSAESLEDLFTLKKTALRRARRPIVDDELHFL